MSADIVSAFFAQKEIDSGESDLRELAFFVVFKSGALISRTTNQFILGPINYCQSAS